jgi:hypothetical protein
MGAVVALQRATGLRSLLLIDVTDSHGLMYIPLLTQVTDLYMAGVEGIASLVVGDPPKSPLLQMEGLRSLSLMPGWHLCNNWEVDEAGLGPVLPPKLTALEVFVPSTQQPGMFWRHIAVCTDLVTLEVLAGSRLAADNPSIMLQVLAGHLKGLTQLLLGEGYHVADDHSVNQLPEVLGLLASTEEAQQQEEEQGWDWQQPPELLLGPEAISIGCVHNNVVIPPPNMGGLSALQSLQLQDGLGNGWWLVCSAPHHWVALASCRQLRELVGLHASQPPPGDVKFPGVTSLFLGARTGAGGAVEVLRAFPAVRDLELLLVPPTAEEVSHLPGQLPTFCAAVCHA